MAIFSCNPTNIIHPCADLDATVSLSALEEKNILFLRRLSMLHYSTIPKTNTWCITEKCRFQVECRYKFQIYLIIINPLSITYELSPKALEELSSSILLLLAEANGVELHLDVATGVEESRGYFGFDKLKSKCLSVSTTLQEKIKYKPHTNYKVCSKLKDY